MDEVENAYCIMLVGWVSQRIPCIWKYIYSLQEKIFLQQDALSFLWNQLTPLPLKGKDFVPKVKIAKN